jgi:hypothetical protein
MRLGLGIALNRGAFVGGLDPDAAAYIDAVVAAGATVSGGQKSAINTFYKTGKADGWYSSLKRMYLPIWAVAAPNAIDMIALGSGTFNGTVTHSAGFVQGDGSTGYFQFSSTPSADSLLATSNFQFMLIKQAETGIANSTQGTDNPFRFRRTAIATGVQTMISGSSAICSAAILRINQVGIFAASRIATQDHAQYQRITSGFSTLATDVVTSTTVAVPTVAYTSMAQGGSVGFFDAQQGAYGYGLGLSLADTSAFTLALKNLWEGTTGLTLP